MWYDDALLLLHCSLASPFYFKRVTLESHIDVHYHFAEGVVPGMRKFLQPQCFQYAIHAGHVYTEAVMRQAHI